MISNALLSPLIDSALANVNQGGNMSFGNAGTATIFTSFAYMCVLTKKCYLKKVPTLVNGVQSPQTSLHIYDSLMGNGETVDLVPRPLPFLLLKSPKGERQDVPARIRNSSIQCFGRPKTYDCDEYPYASTLNGGDTSYFAGQVSLRAIPLGDNRAQGSRLGRFYKATGLTTPKPFINLAIPFLPSFYIDVRGRINPL